MTQRYIGLRPSATLAWIGTHPGSPTKLHLIDRVRAKLLAQAQCASNMHLDCLVHVRNNND